MVVATDKRVYRLSLRDALLRARTRAMLFHPDREFSNATLNDLRGACKSIHLARLSPLGLKGGILRGTRFAEVLPISPEPCFPTASTLGNCRYASRFLAFTHGDL